MPFHFCHEELQMLLAAVPMVGFVFTYLFTRVKARLHRKKPCECPHKDKRDETQSASGVFRHE